MLELSLGVGACGRRPLRVRRPRGVRRARRQGRTVLGPVALHSCKKVMGGAGAEAPQGLRWAPEMVVAPRREHHFRLGGCAGRPRVPEGGAGGLPELMLGSPKVIVELSGVHFGLFESHF